MTGAPPQPQLRRATAADSEACFRLFWDSISDLAARNGTPWEGAADDRWPSFIALYALLAEIAVEWWVAEDDAARLIGYARSIERLRNEGLSIVLVSDPFHMFRLAILARRFGLRPRTSPTRTRISGFSFTLPITAKILKPCSSPLSVRLKNGSSRVPALK